MFEAFWAPFLQLGILQYVAPFVFFVSQPIPASFAIDFFDPPPTNPVTRLAWSLARFAKRYAKLSLFEKVQDVGARGFFHCLGVSMVMEVPQ